MSLPERRRDMLHAGYRLLNPAAQCAKCRGTVELWETTHQRKVYFNPPSKAGDMYERAVFHRETCAARHKEPEQRSLWQGTPAEKLKAASSLARACRALCSGAARRRRINLQPA